jgi:hypothetical protein
MVTKKQRKQLQTDHAWSVQQRRILLLLGAAVAVAVAAMALWPASKTSIDFRTVRMPWSAAATGFRDTRWYELGPKDWDPYKEERELRRKGAPFSDSDPQAAELLKKLRDLWDNAPINPALEGAAVRIPGYVVPLEQTKDGVKDFLLVPYFGACIHSPPPPSNQILRVTAPRPIPKLRSMDNVWVSGRLRATRSDTSMGRSSYAMQVDVIEPYKRKEE